MFQRGTAVENIMALGRWQHVRTCRVYLQDGVARLTELSFGKQLQDKRCSYSQVLGLTLS